MDDFEICCWYDIEICYGKFLVLVVEGEFNGVLVLFLVCYGDFYVWLLYQVNYWVNMQVFKDVGVIVIVVVNVVGGIIVLVGVLVLFEQIIDYIWGCDSILFDDLVDLLVYVDFSWFFDLVLCCWLCGVLECVGL